MDALELSLKTDEELMRDLLAIVSCLGWNYAAPDGDVNGMVIGTQEYIEDVLGEAEIPLLIPAGSQITWH